MKLSRSPRVSVALPVPAEVTTVAPRTSAPRYTAALVIFAFLNALCYPLIAIALPEAPHLSFAALRALVAGSALALVAAVLRRPLPREPGTWLGLAAIGLGATSLGYLGMFHAAEFVSPGLATVITNGQPLIAAILAYLFLRERLRPMQRLGLLLGFVGIVVISLPQIGGAGNGGFGLGLLYIILATIGVAFGNVLMKALAGRVDPLVAMAAQSLFGAVPLALAAAVREQPSAIQWSTTFIGSLLGLALFGTALAYWLWFALLERIPLSRANAFSFLTPFIGFGLGVAFFGERPGFASIIGLSLTAAGILLAQRNDLVHARIRQAQP